MNYVELEGILEDDPEIRVTRRGWPHCNFLLSVETFFKKDDGTDGIRREKHRVTTWNALAEEVVTTCSKGDVLKVTGRLRTRRRAFEGGARYITEVEASNVTHLGLSLLA